MEVDRPIAIAVILFIILIGIFYFVSPKYQEFTNLQAQISQKEAEYRGRSAYFTDIMNTYDKLKQKEEGLKKINSALPSELSIPDLIYFIQGKSFENGLIFRGANFLKTTLVKEGKKINETSIIIEVSGPYPAFKNFLQSLEKSARLIEVEDVYFVVQKEFVGILDFDLTVKVYSY